VTQLRQKKEKGEEEEWKKNYALKKKEKNPH
jgi:hypothetical protein